MSQKWSVPVIALMASTLMALTSPVTLATGRSPATDRGGDDVQATAPNPPGRLVDIGGRKLHLLCSGQGGPTVILENGSDGFSVDWALVQPQVAKFATVCAYDRAGFAWSDRGPAINTVEQTMDDLHLLLRAAGLRPPYVLVGHSIGGLFVRAYQRRYPQEIIGMVLVDGTPEEDLGYAVKGVNTMGINMNYDDMETYYAPFLKNPPPRPQPWTEVLEPFTRLPRDLGLARMWAENKWFSQIDMSHSWITAESWRQEFVALRRLRLNHPYVLGNLPLVVLHRGRRSDPVLDQREAEMAKMSRSGVEWVAGESDHFIQLWQPELVTKAIRRVVIRGKHA